MASELFNNKLESNNHEITFQIRTKVNYEQIRANINLENSGIV